MLFEIVLAVFIGILFGTITGLIPGIHINLIGAILISISTILLGITSPIILAIFIVSMAITHTFIDFIPSIFLGAPDEDTVLSILPGHELLKKGRGYEAIVLSSYGSLAAIFIIILISPIFILLLPNFKDIIKILIPYLLIISTIFLISKEKYKLSAVIVFLLSGFLGISVLNLDLNEPFLPLLSGLFGASALIISIKTKVQIQKQILTKPRINKKEFVGPLIASMFAAPLTSFLPGLGSGQAAVIGSSFKKLSQKQFLILLGATNTIVLGLSFIVLYIIERKRTGMAIILDLILKNLTLNHIIIILTTITIVGIIAFYLTLYLGKIFSKKISNFNYSKISLVILIFLSTIVLIFSGFQGFFIYIIATATGIFGILSNVRRINLMGVLVLPVILTYLM